MTTDRIRVLVGEAIQEVVKIHAATHTVVIKLAANQEHHEERDNERIKQIHADLAAGRNDLRELKDDVRKDINDGLVKVETAVKDLRTWTEAEFKQRDDARSKERADAVSFRLLWIVTGVSVLVGPVLIEVIKRFWLKSP